MTCSSSSPASSAFVSFNACNFFISSWLTGQKWWLKKVIWAGIKQSPLPMLLPCVDLQRGLQDLSSLLCRAGQLLGAQEVACCSHLQHCDHSRVGVQAWGQLGEKSHSQNSFINQLSSPSPPPSSVPLCLRLWCPKRSSSRRWGRPPVLVWDAPRLREGRESEPRQRPRSRHEDRREERTWLVLLELLLLVVVHHNVRLHRDHLLFVELAEVQQGELVKLLVAEQHLRKNGGGGGWSSRTRAGLLSWLSPPCLSASWPRSKASARPGGGWGHTGNRCCVFQPSYVWRTPSGWFAGRPAGRRTRTSAALQCPPVQSDTSHPWRHISTVCFFFFTFLWAKSPWRPVPGWWRCPPGWRGRNPQRTCCTSLAPSCSGPAGSGSPSAAKRPEAFWRRHGTFRSDE